MVDGRHTVVQRGQRDSAGELEKLEALGMLCSTLARMFAYPSREQAEAFTNADAVAYGEELACQAGLGSEELDACARAAYVAAQEASAERARRMRVLYTQLFFRPYAPVPLEGRRWVARSTPASAALGETASVARCYRESGLAVREGVTDRSDALSTELDYLAYLLQQEVRFGDEGNGAQALAWKRRRLAFTADHVRGFALGVAAGIRECCSWPMLLFWTELLERAVARCGF